MTGSPETLRSIQFSAKPGIIIGTGIKAWRGDHLSKFKYLNLELKIKFWNGEIYHFYLNMEEAMSVLETLFGEYRYKVEEQVLEGLFVHVKYESGGQGPAMLVAIFGKGTVNDKDIWQPHKPFFAESSHY